MKSLIFAVILISRLLSAQPKAGAEYELSLMTKKVIGENYILKSCGYFVLQGRMPYPNGRVGTLMYAYTTAPRKDTDFNVFATWQQPRIIIDETKKVPTMVYTRGGADTIRLSSGEYERAKDCLLVPPAGGIVKDR